MVFFLSALCLAGECLNCRNGDQIIATTRRIISTEMIIRTSRNSTATKEHIVAVIRADITHGSKYGSFTKILSRPSVSGNVIVGFAKNPLTVEELYMTDSQ